MAHRDDGKPYIPHHKRADMSPLDIPDCSITHTIYSSRQHKPTLWQRLATLSMAFWIVYAFILYYIVQYIILWTH